MRSDRTVISLDLGTSSVRACLVTSSLEVLFQSQRQISLETDLTGKAIQDVGEIIQVGLVCLIEALTYARAEGLTPQAMCFSNTAASLVCLNSRFEPLGPALTYVDLRAFQESTKLIEEYGPAFFRETAVPMHASYWLPKLLWIKSQPGFDQECAYYCTIKDLFVHRLTGEFVIDRCNVFVTGMGDVRTGDWHGEMLAIAGIRREQLPEVRSVTDSFPCLPTSPLPQGLIPQGFQIVLGAMDGTLASLGAGAFLPGQVTTTIGSSGACRIARKTPLLGDDLLTWSYPLEEDLWICGGAMNNGGLVTQWLVENFSDSNPSGDESYEQVFRIAEKIPAGAEGLIFLPYLFGERAPIYNEQARGVFFGLRSNHHRGHFARAGLEGILLALYSVFALLAQDPTEIELRATGGYLRSDLMLQIQADIFGTPVHVPGNLEGSSVGAAMVALIAIGEIGNYTKFANAIPIVKTYQPNLDNAACYQEAYQRFKALYQQLIPLF